MRRDLVFAALIMGTLTACAVDGAGERIVISSPSKPAVLGLGESSKKFAYLREFIEYYFTTRCGVKPEIMDIPRALKKQGCRMILCTRDEAKKTNLGEKNSSEISTINSNPVLSLMTISSNKWNKNTSTQFFFLCFCTLFLN